jgi:HlyD family secretion protein
MKAIIQKIEEMTDSRELLEAKPHPFLAIFIYLLSLLIIAALTWCYFGEIDIVIKANGIVRPDQKISTIRSKVFGKVTGVYYEDGQRINKGDLLLTVERSGLDIERSAISQDLTKTRNELFNVKALKDCILANKPIEASKTSFIDDDKTNEFYYRYLDYTSNIRKLSNSIQQRQEVYNSQQKLLDDGVVSADDVKNAKDALDLAELDLQIYRNKYMLEIQDTINADEKALNSLEKTFKSTNLNFQDLNIIAPIVGVINVMTEINKGDLLESGVTIATIVPANESRFKVQLYVPNKDIANIKVGDRIKYHFLALPYREYGELSGKIINIGIDSKIDQQRAESVYLVEAGIDNKPLYSYKGNKAEVKVGMLCEAQIITKTKKILYYLLEKINLMD